MTNTDPIERAQLRKAGYKVRATLAELDAKP